MKSISHEIYKQRQLTRALSLQPSRRQLWWPAAVIGALAVAAAATVAIGLQRDSHWHCARFHAKQHLRDSYPECGRDRSIHDPRDPRGWRLPEHSFILQLKCACDGDR